MLLTNKTSLTPKQMKSMDFFKSTYGNTTGYQLFLEVPSSSTVYCHIVISKPWMVNFSSIKNHYVQIDDNSNTE